MSTTLSTKLALFSEAYLTGGGPRHFTIDREEGVNVEEMFKQAVAILAKSEPKPPAPSSPSLSRSVASKAPDSQGL